MITTDINERVEMPELLDHLTYGIIVYDKHGDILYCNRPMADFFGLTCSKLSSMSVNGLVNQGIVDSSFFNLTIKSKKPITFDQRCISGLKLVTKVIPVLDGKGGVNRVIQQSYPLEQMEFESGQEDTFSQPSLAVETYGDEVNGHTSELQSKEMERLYSLADSMAPKNINILILGDSGTGKSLLAKRIHNNSTRRLSPFVTINCSTIPENLLESELFGYTKGSFSGAMQSGKPGLVDMASGGTLFLDEIGELPLSIQSKLLQLVQEKTYLPLGSLQHKTVDTRIIAATNKNLLDQVKKGLFREDLYYRLAVVTLAIPPLTGRTCDIETLLIDFTNRFNVKHDTNVRFSRESIELLKKQPWPGNIRELEHLVEVLVLSSANEYITPQLLRPHLTTKIPHYEPSAKGGNFLPLDLEKISSFDSFIQDQEQLLVEILYPEYNSSYKLAQRLSISQSKASRLIRKYINK